MAFGGTVVVTAAVLLVGCSSSGGGISMTPEQRKEANIVQLTEFSSGEILSDETYPFDEGSSAHKSTARCFGEILDERGVTFEALLQARREASPGEDPFNTVMTALGMGEDEVLPFFADFFACLEEHLSAPEFALLLQ